MRKFLVFTVMLGILATIAVSAFAVPPVRSPAYGNDKIYELMGNVPFPLKAAEPSYKPTYQVGLNPAAPSVFGDVTEVVAVPPENKGTFSAIWEVVLVVPGTNAEPGTNVTIVYSDDWGVDLVQKVDLDDGGGLIFLTSEAKILEAEALGLVEIVDMEMAFVCPVVKVGKAEAPPAQKRRSKVTTTWAKLKSER